MRLHQKMSVMLLWPKFKVTVSLFHQIMTYPPNLANDAILFHANYVTFVICESEETSERFY